MKQLLVVSILLIACSQNLCSQQVVMDIEEGNGYYKNNEYSRAADAYQKAMAADPSSKTAKFNLANTQYKLDQKVEAVQMFTALTRDAREKDIRAKSFYNKGVILSQQKNLEESIEAYKNAIRLDPSDKQARENLQKALLELRKKNAAPKKDNKQDKKKQDPKQQKQPQSRMSQKETEQRLKLLQQKEKEVQQRLQRDKAGEGGSRPKDW